MISSPLGNALKSAFKLEGLQILSDPVIYNVLWDLGGFEDSTEVRRAFKTFVNGGYSKRLYDSIKKYNPLTLQCNKEKVSIQLSREEVVFENSNTTSSEVSKYIFEALRDALDVTFQPVEEPHRKAKSINKLWKALLSISIFIVCVILAITLRSNKQTVPNDISCNSVVELAGNYSIRVNSESGEFFFTGKITKVEQGEYSLFVVTEFGPETFSIFYNPDDKKLYSSKLGNGEISVNDVTSSVTLTFNNESTSWKLSK